MKAMPVAGGGFGQIVFDIDLYLVPFVHDEGGAPEIGPIKAVGVCDRAGQKLLCRFFEGQIKGGATHCWRNPKIGIGSRRRSGARRRSRWRGITGRNGFCFGTGTKE